MEIILIVSVTQPVQIPATWEPKGVQWLHTNCGPGNKRGPQNKGL